MGVARLSTKGQIVIPQELRDRLGWRPGDTFEVLERDGALLLVPSLRRPRPTTLDEVAGMLHVEGPPLSVEEMQAAVDAELRRKWSAG